ncbi:MAG: shikimate kinase [Acidobacteriota bacterium]|nr:shikimate kinase [Acidobacteriota bacterium]
MKFFAVAGSPILHSKSPRIFKHFFRNFPMEAAYGRVAADSAGEIIFIFNSFSFDGMNITAPFKTEIISYLSELDEVALATGSVNTIIKWKDGIKGFNTDPAGVVMALERRNIQLAGKKCLVIGAGGAGASAAFGLIQKGAEVTIVNRTAEKARKLAASLGCQAAEPDSLAAIIREAEIIISAITSGEGFIKKNWLKKDQVVLEANYKQPVILPLAASAGCQVISGEEWLYHQAVGAREIFFSQQKGGQVEPGTFRSHDSGRQPAPIGQTSAVQVLSNFSSFFDQDDTTKKRRNITLVGFMGSGKTSIGERLALKMGSKFIDTDRLIESREKMSIEEIFNKKGEAYFRAEEKVTIRKLAAERGAVFSPGAGAIMDEESRQILKENSTVIFLYSTLKTCLKRASGTKRPLLDKGNQQEIENLYETRKELYFTTADLMVNSEKSLEEVTDKIESEVGEVFND